MHKLADRTQVSCSKLCIVMCECHLLPQHGAALVQSQAYSKRAETKPAIATMSAADLELRIGPQNTLLAMDPTTRLLRWSTSFHSPLMAAFPSGSESNMLPGTANCVFFDHAACNPGLRCMVRSYYMFTSLET